uniref:G1/S-specific cyclin-E n=4 Tax=Lygus hesperus TaxID=30085 RepID=A0A0A9W8L7_LYGHE
MQLEGSSKRKRRSSASNGDIENSPVCEAKRLREDDEDVDHLATEERLPLTELPVGQPYDPDGSDTDWLEACAEDLSVGDEDEVENNREKLGESEDEDNAHVDENQEPSPKIARVIDNYLDRSSPSPKSASFDRIVFQSRRYFASIPELMNFFKRKGQSSSEDRTDKIFCDNPGLQPKMRSVLLEWIVEVCDVYKLHRETYHLTVDYLDRYLCQSQNISKGQLQLIGVTALLIAAKYEEIYPPKISDFAYITDGACTDQDIIKMENLMVQVLEWRCTLITSNAWVLGFLQLLCIHEKKDSGTLDITVPLYNHLIYETVMHLLDLCTLDCGFVKFSYKVLALSSLHIVMPNPDPVILKVSGYEPDDLAECMDWMQPFWTILCQKFKYEAINSGASASSVSSGRASDFSHLRIKHNIDLDILEAVQMIIESKENSDVIPELLLTPPSSSEKRKGCHNKKATQINSTSNGTILA